jgi:hypothetical protein
MGEMIAEQRSIETEDVEEFRTLQSETSASANLK